VLFLSIYICETLEASASNIFAMELIHPCLFVVAVVGNCQLLAGLNISAHTQVTVTVTVTVTRYLS
jgi:hypothetical protein